MRASGTAAPAGYGDPRGLEELRTAIANHVSSRRGVRCGPDNVVVTNGAQQGLYIAAKLLLEAGDAALVEEPCYPGIAAAVADADAVAISVPLDDQGISIPGFEGSRGVKACFVTPSNQYPTGVETSLARRKALLGWAREADAWIVEDDYDCDMQYAQRPLPSLQGLDPSRVFYLGTLSKGLFPSLRLGYAIVPEPLVEAFAGARSLMDRHSPMTEQRVLASYMAEGHLAAHLRRLAPLCSATRDALIEAVDRLLAPWVTSRRCDQGMHLIAWLRDGINDVEVATAAAKIGIVVRPLSPMYACRPGRAGLMLGFGGFSIPELQVASDRLAEVLQQIARR